MILIGQYDSPFVRRVAIALNLYGYGWEHRPWSSFGDAERVAAHNPMRRVPTLMLDDGEVLIEGSAILDHLDEVAGPDRAMLPARGPGRRKALQACALATGVADKAVALVYERVLHETPAVAWVERCRRQIGDTLAALEESRSASVHAFWLGDTIGHADIALACVLRFLGEAHPGLGANEASPALMAHAARCEALPAFLAVSQPFIAPTA